MDKAERIWDMIFKCIFYFSLLYYFVEALELLLIYCGKTIVYCVLQEWGSSTQSEWLLVSAEYPIYLEPWGNMPFYKERSKDSSFWLMRTCEWVAPYCRIHFNVSLVCPTGRDSPALQLVQVMYFSKCIKHFRWPHKKKSKVHKSDSLGDHSYNLLFLSNNY